MRSFIAILAIPATLAIALSFSACTQETQNQISRSIQNWTGTDGVVDVLSDGKIMYRFIKIDKLSTAKATSGERESRPYRFGYGVLDVNLNYEQDEKEKRIYFEVSDYSTNYVFYENPGTAVNPSPEKTETPL